MKALSVKNPWAEAIRQGIKTIETRSRKTNYRGELLICSSKKPDPDFDLSGEKMIYGQALCIAEIYDCEPMTRAHENDAMCDVYPGAYAWKLRKIRQIEPFPVKGQLGIFEVELK